MCVSTVQTTIQIGPAAPSLLFLLLVARAKLARRVGARRPLHTARAHLQELLDVVRLVRREGDEFFLLSNHI